MALNRKKALVSRKREFDYSRISSRCNPYPKQTIELANGARFTILQVPKADLKTKTNALYIHISRQTRQCYIGITEQRVLDRWTKGNNYRMQKRFGAALRKYGWDAFDHHVLAFADTRRSLERAEVRAIKDAGGHKSRFTFNLSPGGDLVAENDRPVVGVYLPTGKQKRFKSASAASRFLNFVNIDAVAAIARGERQSKDDWWFRYEEDTERSPPLRWGEDLRVAKLRDMFGKRVIAINLKTKERLVFKTFSSAAKSLKISQSLISASVRKRVMSAGGWCFFYEGDCESLPRVYGTAATREKRDRRVFATNLKTGDRQEFRNCTVADKRLELHSGAAASVAAGKRASAGDWFFSYERHKEPPSEYRGLIVARIKSKPVIARSLLSNQEQAFPSAKDAAMALGMSRAAISKSISKAKPAKGYSFRFG